MYAARLYLQAPDALREFRSLNSVNRTYNSEIITSALFKLISALLAPVQYIVGVLAHPGDVVAHLFDHLLDRVAEILQRRFIRRRKLLYLRNE